MSSVHGNLRLGVEERYCASTCGVKITTDGAKFSMVRIAEEKTISSQRDEPVPSQNGRVGKGHYSGYAS